MKGKKIHILVRKYPCQLHHATVAFDPPEHRLVNETELMSAGCQLPLLSKFSKQ